MTRRRGCGTPGPGRVLTLKGHTGGGHRRGVQRRTARGSSPAAETGRRGCGTPRPGPSPHPQGAHGRGQSASFSPDGSRIVTGWTTRRRRCGTPRPGPSPHPQGAHRLGHRRRSARTGRGSSPRFDDKTARVWDAKTGAELLTLKGHTDVRQSAWRSARTGRGSSPGMTGRRGCGTPGPGPSCSPSRGTPDRSLGVAFSPDGSRIVTGVDDKTAKVWDAKTGAELLTLKGHTDDVRVGVVQPGRVADRDRVRTGRRRCGTPGPAPSCSPSRGTRGVYRRRSARTGRGSSPAGRQDGAGVGRQERGRAAHPQGAHRAASTACVQRRTGRGSSPGSRTRRRGCGTPGPGPSSSPSRGTRSSSMASRSGRTGRGSSPVDQRRGCGTPGPGPSCSRSRATPARSRRRSPRTGRASSPDW